MSSRTKIDTTASLDELSLDDLQQLELRIAMLRLMKQQPGITQKELAAHLGVSERTVRRWQKVCRDYGTTVLLTSGQPGSPQDVSTESSPHIPHGVFQRFLQFVNALPRKGTLQEMSRQLSAILIGLFSDVDHAAVAINARCDLKDPGSYRPELVAVQQEGEEAEHFSVAPFSEEEVISGVRKSLAASGFIITEQHQPQHFVYRFDRAFLGVIILWRDTEQAPIGSDTIAFMNSIESFLVMVLSDIVARHAYGSPLDTAFNDALEHLSVRAQLTIREREVLLLLLRGSSYEEAADTLNISRETVKSRMRNVYIKTGTRDLPELFGRYFTPRLTPPEPPEFPDQE